MTDELPQLGYTLKVTSCIRNYRSISNISAVTDSSLVRKCDSIFKLYLLMTFMATVSVNIIVTATLTVNWILLLQLLSYISQYHSTFVGSVRPSVGWAVG